jgi:DNA repair and recombination RAD54-like protein
MSELSGKMAVLDRMLQEMRKRGGERIVIVSNFTQTLDQISLLCRERFFPCVRLDGSMAVKKRRAYPPPPPQHLPSHARALA